jgi:hypothetical protein
MRCTGQCGKTICPVTGAIHAGIDREWRPSQPNPADCEAGAAALRASHDYLTQGIKTLEDFLADKLDAEGHAAEGHLQDLVTFLTDHSQSGGFRAEEVRGAIDRLKEQRTLVHRRWSLLRYNCPEIGPFVPGEADAPPEGGPSFKDPEQSAHLRQLAAQHRAMARKAATDGTGAQAECEAELVTISLPLGDKGASVDVDPSKKCAQLAHQGNIRQDHFNDVADDLDRLANDPPSNDFRRVVKVTATIPPELPDADRLDSIVWAADEAQRWASAYLNGYITSFERYQGAQKAGAAKAMLSQANAMRECAGLSRVWARRVAFFWHAYDVQLHALEHGAEAKAAGRGADMAVAFDQWKERTARDGIDAASLRGFGEQGVSPEEIRKRTKDLLALTFDEVSRVSRERGLQASIDEAIAVGVANTRGAGWPEPGHIAALDLLELSAADLQRSVGGTRLRLALDPASVDPLVWYVAAEGTPPSLRQSEQIEGPESGPLMPGRYDLYVLESTGRLQPLAVRVARGVTVAWRQTTDVAIRSGIRLVLAEPISPPYAWFVVPADGTSTGPIVERSEATVARPAFLPPGRYDVYWIETQDHRSSPMLLKSGVDVVNEVMTDVTCGGIRFQPALWIPNRDEAAGWFGVSEVGKDVTERTNWKRTGDYLVLPPGHYDLYWVQDYEHQNAPLLACRDIEVTTDRFTNIPLDSGVQLVVGEWVPTREREQGWWGAAAVGSGFTDPINWSRDQDKILLPPGTYDVYWKQDFDHQPFLLAKNVLLDEKGPTAVRADVGIALETASWIPKREERQGWWGAAAVGSGFKDPINWSRDQDKILLPTGAYDVYWKQDYDHQPFLLAKNVLLEEKGPTRVRADAGIALEIAPWIPKREERQGWWGAAAVGGGSKDPINWSRDQDKILLPPGTYDVYWKHDFDHQPFLLAGGVVVRSGESAKVKATTGIALEVPAETPPLDAQYGWWGVVPVGTDPSTPLNWCKARFDQPLLVPPGRYDVVWKQEYQQPAVVVKEAVVIAGSGTPLHVAAQPPSKK